MAAAEAGGAEVGGRGAATKGGGGGGWGGRLWGGAGGGAGEVRGSTAASAGAGGGSCGGLGAGRSWCWRAGAEGGVGMKAGVVVAILEDKGEATPVAMESWVEFLGAMGAEVWTSGLASSKRPTVGCCLAAIGADVCKSGLLSSKRPPTPPPAENKGPELPRPGNVRDSEVSDVAFAEAESLGFCDAIDVESGCTFPTWPDVDVDSGSNFVSCSGADMRSATTLRQADQAKWNNQC
jgi:hypothetical protein